MPGEKRSFISMDTVIPISLLITLAGGIFWLSTMFSNVQQNTKSIESLQEQVTEVNNNYVNLLDRTARIETKLDLILEAVK